MTAQAGTHKHFCVEGGQASRPIGLDQGESPPSPPAQARPRPAARGRCLHLGDQWEHQTGLKGSLEWGCGVALVPTPGQAVLHTGTGLVDERGLASCRGGGPSRRFWKMSSVGTRGLLRCFIWRATGKDHAFIGTGSAVWSPAEEGGGCAFGKAPCPRDPASQGLPCS